MSLLVHAIECFQAHPHIIDKFSETLRPELIEEALRATGTASVRRRKLPAEQVVWLTVGMAMFSNTSIRQTLDRLSLTVNGHVVPSTISNARKRLGPKPLSYLFTMLAKAWTEQSPASTWRGLRLFGVDGTTIRTADSDDNFEHFGKPGTARGGDAAYPQVRILGIMDLGLRMLYSARVGPLSQGELTMARDALGELPNDSVCLMDRGFSSFAHFHSQLHDATNRHFLCRASLRSKYEVQELLDDGSLIAVLHPSPQVRKENPEITGPLKIRVVDYQVEGHGVCRLFTSLLDHKRFPARAVAELYHERWELELAFDELKTDMLNRKECLRSKYPDGVEQEVWSILLTYNLIRREMALTAQAHNAKPSTMSFKASMLFIHDFFVSYATDPATGRLPERLRKLREDLWRYRLPARRSERSAPRQVKIKMSAYRKKPAKRRELAQGA
jgi:Insertion element 4 transposase N-terminal/Transposase DDE domain